MASKSLIDIAKQEEIRTEPLSITKASEYCKILESLLNEHLPTYLVKVMKNTNFILLKPYLNLFTKDEMIKEVKELLISLDTKKNFYFVTSIISMQPDTNTDGIQYIKISYCLPCSRTRVDNVTDLTSNSTNNLLQDDKLIGKSIPIQSMKRQETLHIPWTKRRRIHFREWEHLTKNEKGIQTCNKLVEKPVPIQSMNRSETLPIPWTKRRRISIRREWEHLTEKEKSIHTCICTIMLID